MAMIRRDELKIKRQLGEMTEEITSTSTVFKFNCGKLVKNGLNKITGLLLDSCKKYLFSLAAKKVIALICTVPLVIQGNVSNKINILDDMSPGYNPIIYEKTLKERPKISINVSVNFY